jgi:tRNA modification GTPase
MMDSDTIFAVASGAVRSAICVIRITGTESSAIVGNLCGKLPPARHAALRRVRAADGTVLDHGLLLWMPGPASYTGEDSAELHLHGGRAVVQAVAAALVAAGARPAEPGEFTRRAFVQGRMDLLEAEGVADLVAAETEAQRLQALRQMEGAQSQVLAGWAERLRRMLAWQEALIDFPDEDLPEDVERALTADISALAADLAAAEQDARRGARVRDGLVVAVTGAPNVGKSSLVNALAGRDVAIVAPTPGTTRDALEVALALAGVPVTLIDTAGLRETDDPVEAEGVRRARARAERADLVLLVLDASRPEIVAAEAALLVANKIDMAPAMDGALGVSAVTGAGMGALRAMLEDAVRALTAVSGPAVLSHSRHAASLREAVLALRAADEAVLPELRGEELRAAMQALGRITGAVDVEAILDTVFGAFCIGK